MAHVSQDTADWTSAETFLSSAFKHHREGNTEAAIEKYRAALERAPDCYPAILNQAGMGAILENNALLSDVGWKTARCSAHLCWVAPTTELDTWLEHPNHAAWHTPGLQDMIGPQLHEMPWHSIILPHTSPGNPAHAPSRVCAQSHRRSTAIT